ncbi:hypothetical protein PHRODO_30 [Bacillus phage Phrodo]|nr:hypothetical protein BI003_gp030 [Bacillus phage Phrodo]AMW62078.1 hypothetical protein PHRODO_30 [Bacillus phage Phrodo]
MTSDEIRKKIDTLFDIIDEKNVEIDRLIERLEERGEEY